MRLSLPLAVLFLTFLAHPATAAAPEQLPPAVAEIRKQLGLDDLDAAVDAAEKSLEALPGDARAWFWSGRAYGLQAMRASLLSKPKWAGRSRDAYEKAVALDPELIEARYDLLQYYLFAPGFLGGGRDKADAQAAELARRDLVWGKLAESSLAMADKKPEVAEAALRDAVTKVPDSARARQALAGMLQRQARWDEVRQLWRERLSQNAEDPTARYQLGRAAALTGAQLEDGLSQLDAFVAAGVIPEGLSAGAAHWRRGQVLEKLGRRDDAITALKLAVSDSTTRKQAQPDLDRVVKGA
jgi:tetratricopeptide (TPR) repeat protein